MSGEVVAHRDGRRTPGRPPAPVHAALACIATCVLLSACAIGPDYQRPVVASPERFRQEPPPGWKEAGAADRLPRGRWWVLFGDSTLDALADQAMVANHSVQVAEATWRQARAQLAQAGAARYPVLSGGFSATRSTGSRGGTSAGGLGGEGGTVSSESYRLGLDASWAPDLWGRVRRSIEAGEAQLEAAGADLENARLVVVSDLARAYFELRVLDAQRQLLADTVAAYERSVQLTRNRYRAGIVARADVVQAEVQWKSTRAQLLDTGLQRAALESTIAVLVGRTPASFQLDAVTAAPERPRLDRPPPADGSVVAPASTPWDYPGIPLPPAVPTGLPSELLERRPDVAAAERAVAASSARIGIAQAAWYPSLSLSASAGLRETSFGDLLGSPAWFWSPTLSVLQLLFDGGERRAVVAQAQAAHEAQVAAYRQSVLLAFKEVEDNLAALRIIGEEIELQADTLASARLALQLVNNQYQAGVVNYLNVITAQTAALNAERALLDLRARQLAATVALVRALGGGWEGLEAASSDGFTATSGHTAGKTPPPGTD
ncbi:MAG: efflux transporter outer membrane subunit [Burkholderiaceae bacterium]|nr:efflux transporter outer membrane subunit [Burkholderiaceae bacterium]